YHAEVVPVGEDQRQHLELARDLAQRFNNRYGPTFTVPEGTFPAIGAKITDLQEPTSRMSTSTESDAGVIRMLDPPDVIRRKVKSAVTDSGRDVVCSPEKPGITNLIEILAVSSGRSPGAIEAAYGASGYGPFKADVAEAVVEVVTPIQERYAELRADRERLDQILARGAEKAHDVAAATLRRAHDAIGFV
ncbi:MAG: tryptophan--tRNA ligase, partial [Gaiellales bacterium]